MGWSPRIPYTIGGSFFPERIQNSIAVIQTDHTPFDILGQRIETQQRLQRSQVDHDHTPFSAPYAETSFALQATASNRSNSGRQSSPATSPSLVSYSSPASSTSASGTPGRAASAMMRS